MIQTILTTTAEKMKKAIEVGRTDISSIRSGRATPALVEQIVISCYGGSQRLKVMELATITTMDAKTLVISPYDPATLTEVEKGILEANVGLTPVVDGEIIRITIPLLSAERRQEYIKLVRTKLEAVRVMIRQIRHEAMKELRIKTVAKEMSEDEGKHGEKLVQELTDKMIAEVDAMGERKEADLLSV